jgi:hypothetical protein
MSDRATGKALTRLALMYGFRRRWYEYVPIVGDRWLRARVSAALYLTLTRR